MVVAGAILACCTSLKATSRASFPNCTLNPTPILPSADGAAVGQNMVTAIRCDTMVKRCG